jgi:hypothetical protein
MSIAATRMYRGLDDFLSSDMYDDRLLFSSLRSLRDKSDCSSSHRTPHNGGPRMSVSGAWVPAVPIPLDGTVDVRTAHSQSLTSQAIRNSLGNNTDRTLHDKPHELA